MKNAYLALPMAAAAFLFQGCFDGPSNPDAGAPKSDETWVKEYIAIESGPRPEFKKEGNYAKPEFQLPDQIGEVDWAPEALAKGMTEKPFLTRALLTNNQTSCPATYNRVDLDLNKGAGGKYVYLCWSKDHTQEFNMSGAAGIHKIFGEDWVWWSSKYNRYMPSRNATTFQPYGVGGTFTTYSDGVQWGGGTITGRYLDTRDGSNGDANQSAGGSHYLYLVHIFTNPQHMDRVKELKAISGGSSDVACPTGFEKVTWLTGGAADMNKYVGGSFVYVCQKIGY
jgi:hypothetical protein